MAHPKGGYRLANGDKVPGVTTIINRFKESGGLIYWAFGQGKAAERGEIDKLYDKRDEAAKAGTLAHSMVEAHINKQPLPNLLDSSEKIVNQAQQGFKNYLTWEENNQIKVVYQEIRLVSEKYRFGGCPDAIGMDSKNQLCLLDWKTSSKGPYVDYLIQVAAYGYLWDSEHPDNPITGGFHLLKFSKETGDFSHHYWSELNDAWEQFKLFRKAYDLDKALKKRI